MPKSSPLTRHRFNDETLGNIGATLFSQENGKKLTRHLGKLACQANIEPIYVLLRLLTKHLCALLTKHQKILEIQLARHLAKLGRTNQNLMKTLWTWHLPQSVPMVYTSVFWSLLPLVYPNGAYAGETRVGHRPGFGFCQPNLKWKVVVQPRIIPRKNPRQKQSQHHPNITWKSECFNFNRTCNHHPINELLTRPRKTASPISLSL